MWLSDLKIVLPDGVVEHGSICIEGEHIVDMMDRPIHNSASAFPVAGLTAIPGIIDMHGDMIEREMEPRPNARLPLDLAAHELDKRLAASGVTTAYAAVSFSEISIRFNNLRRHEVARDIVNALAEVRSELTVDTRIHVRFEVTNPHAPPVLKELLSEGKVDLISLNDHTPGQGQYRDIQRYLKEMERWSKLSSDYEAVTLDTVRAAQERPVAWNVIRELAEIAHKHALKITSHDDDTPEKIALMHELGVTMSEFPVSLEAAQAAHAHGMAVIMGAPNAFRGVSTSNNLSARDGVRAGLVDLLAADYHPGLLLQAAFVLVQEGLLPLHEAIKLISTNVATALGLDDRGAIAVGKLADLVLVDESAGQPARPYVRATFRAGRPIYLHRQLAAQSISTLVA